jgi:serine protease
VNLVLYPITEVNLVATPAAGIPDFNPTGLTSVINVPNAGVVSGLDVGINITHPSRGHLTVTLTSPSGTTVYLHNHTGGTADNIIGNWPATLLVDGPGTLADFLQEPAQGDWTLHVADTQFGAVGTFQSWGLNLLVRATPVAAAGDGLFTATRLVSNVPNPFNPQTTVNFDLASPGPVVLAVYDVRGSRVIELLRESLPAGRHQVIWNGLDDQGHAVGSGLYFCRLQAGGRQEMMKMMLVR